MKKVALYGGAFNPVTKGHVMVVNNIINAKLVDEVWFLPSFKSLWGKDLAPAADRVAMLKLQIENDCTINQKIVKVCTFEIDKKINGIALEVVQQLKKQYKNNCEFFFAIGTDQANQITKWDRYEELTDLIPFIVIQRFGHPWHPLVNDKEFWQRKNVRYISVRADEDGEINISSTIARESLSGTVTVTREADPEEFMCEEVIKYAVENKLYRRASAGFVEKECPFCGNGNLLAFREHYYFCPECTAIFTYMSVYESDCEHIKDKALVVDRETWYKIKEKTTYVNWRKSICSICGKEVKLGGW